MKKANIMKNMKTLIGILAVAWCACALPWRASAAGDIIGIYPVDAEGNLRSAPVSSVSDPFWPTESEPMRFALRLKGAASGRGWRLNHTGKTYSQANDATNNPFRIGIYVSGDLRYATIDGREKQTDDSTGAYTDFYFRYDVKPGDLALPIVLAVKGSDGNPSLANGSAAGGSVYYTSPLLVEMDGTPVWTIDDSTDSESATTSAVLSFAADDGNLMNTDYDLRGAGFFVKTLDLSVSETVPAYQSRTGMIRLDSAYESASTNLTKLYVWSMDETVVKVLGTETKSIRFSSSGTPESRSVAVITLKKGQQDYTFSIQGGADAVVGQSTTLVMSGFDDFHYAPVTGARREDYLSATVTVTPSTPCLQLLDETGKDATLSIEATENASSYTKMKLSIGKPYVDGPVTVALKQQINGVDVSAEEDYIANRYFAISASDSFSPDTGTSLRELTLPAGETELEFYVFAFGSSAALKSPGLTLVPDVSAQSQEIRDFFAVGAGDQKNALLRITDQAPTVSVTAPADGVKGGMIDVDVSVADNWRDLNPNLNTNGYRVAIAMGGQTVLETNGVHFTEGETQTFAVKLPQSGSLKGVVKVWDATHDTKPGQADFSIEVEPALAATAVFYPDSDPASEPYADGYFFTEGSSPYFRVKLTTGAASDMWAFLVPVDAAASNYVACSACSNGLFIAGGDLVSAAATLTFLDGFSSKEPMRARFRVELRDQEQYDAPGSRNLDAGYEIKMFELTCVNVSSTLVDGSMELNATPVSNNGTLMSRVPAGVEVRFRARVSDPSPIDMAATGDKAIVTRWQFTDGAANNQRVYTRFATNANGYVTCPYSFYEAGVKQTVTVWARDKDDLVERGDLDWGDPVYTFYVYVDESPRVVLSSTQASTNTAFSIDENVTKVSGYLSVTLSERPSDSSDSSLPISRNNPLVVELQTEAWGTDGFLALETNRVYFTNVSGEEKKVYYDFDSLDGGNDTIYQVTARVITSTSSNAYDQAWSDYYVEGSVQITVLDVAPSIDSVKRTNGLALIEPDYGTNTWSAGETVALHWKISDVLPDVTNGNLQVNWSIDPSIDSPTQNPQTITNGWSYTTMGRKTVVEGDYVFSVPSVSGTLRMVVTDESVDGAQNVREWYFEVEKTKDIKVNVFGPAATAQSKYKAALGLGQGTVGAAGAAKKASEGFVQTWTYAQTALSAELYAWGYPSKETWDAYVGSTSPSYGVYVDRGGIPAAVGSSADSIALGVSGNTWTAGPYYDWSTMGGLDATAGDYDNYFYRWMVVKAASSGTGGGSSAQTEIAAAPTTWPLATTRKAIDLDSGNKSSGSGDKDKEEVTYGTVEVEAIFSRELYPKDNLGDINADGIPDKIVEAYGLGAATVGEMPEDDLASLKDFNDDEDYLPNMSGSSYSTLIPGLPSTWAEGTKFTALYEVRGYHEGLNDAAQQIGVKNRLEADFYSNDVEKRKAARDYSELEMLAWSFTGYDKNWTPECPSDPTKADTDGDEFPDGYEYYFWYRAHVGDLEYFATTGKFRRLTGRRYDPKNPGRGTVITAEEIESIMNPQVAYGAAPNEIDSDNDGLPDLLEFELGTNPFDFDTDGDGLPDGWEIMIAGLDPLTAQSYTDGKSDTERNTDGDAMAISSYKLEQTEKPVPVNIEHAKRVTFAVIDPNGDTDGVQWYAMRTSPTLDVKETFTNGYEIVADVDGIDVEFFSATAPTVVTDGATKRIAVACSVRTLELDPDNATGKSVCGYPYTLPVGTTVRSITDGVTAKSYKITADVAAKDANACWIYGKGSARAEIGKVAETAAEYGCLALARQHAVTAGTEVAVLPSDERDVAFLHFLCYQEFGFDPRTAWCPNDPLAKRWGKSVDGEAVEGITVIDRGGYTGAPARTRAYTNYDEFLVSSFFWNNEGGQPSLVTPVTAADATNWARVWGALTTNPQGPNDAKKTSDDHYYGRDSVNGADTDGDGVPDGWELYVMAGPKAADGSYVFAPPYAGFTPALAGAAMEESYLSPFIDAAKTADTNNQIYLGGEGNDDGLNEFHEFEGTDSMNYYADYSTTIVHDVAADGEWKWFNKFFPTDPWHADTDGDGLSDGEEKKHFIYGTPEDDGTSRAIAGGGLNPCSVDTDCDGLPDGWEAQFAGTPASVVEGEQSLGLRDGMDGTVKDAYTTPMNTTVGSSKEGRVNRDYDHDGLENWQEYLTGTMRCWRYDDPVSPLTYQPRDFYFFTNTAGEVVFDATEAAKKFQAAGMLDSDDVNEFWYKTLVDASSAIYNPHLVMDTSSGAQYFSRVTNVWDAAYLDILLSGGKATGAYYWFYDRVDGNLLKDTWGAAWAALIGDEVKGLSFVPTKYASCSPIDPDSDHDGMDDYYEVFHGMNPLLGESGREGRWWKVNGGGIRAESDILDLVYDSMYTSNEAMTVPQAWGSGNTMNFWQRKVADASWKGKKPCGTGYDFEIYPWLNGLATADPDGDGIRNQEESIMALVSPSTVWHHTDPTPLWMTDSSYSNSLVRMNYRLPTRGDVIAPEGASFTYEGQTYLFSDFDGFIDDSFQVFNPDAWDLVGSTRDMNWIASFEENEGYDTDHDGLGDRDEIGGKYKGETDPLDADSPLRRQAMYFPGTNSLLQTMPFVREYHPETMKGGRYPDDLSFLQYTVECWVKAESLGDSTVIERAVSVGESNPDDQEFIRCNFRIGLEGGKWYTLFDPNDTTKDSVKVFADDAATTAWTHLAATYDAKELVFYVNGKVAGRQTTGLQPTYGSAAVAVNGENGLNAATGMSYWRDREYSLHAIVLGASVKTLAQGGNVSALDVTRAVGFGAYTGFFKGYVDEVRIWDGARTALEIEETRMSRFTASDVASNREAFYAEWSKSGANDQYRGRYAKDGSGNAYPLPAELRFHWSFDSLFGAAEADAVAKVPVGFDFSGSGADGRALLSRPEGYGIDWWQKVLAGYVGTVYNDPAWICWVPNTVTHLPRYDGTTLDSVYWSEDFAGATAGTYKFARTAEPASFWTQYRRRGLNESEIPYETTSSRHHLVSEMDTAGSSQFATLFAFTGRHLNQTGDDLLALGGAFAKHVDDLWDSQGSSSNWEIGKEMDGSGFPKWWRDLANSSYRINPTDVIDWGTLVVWPEQGGTVMTAGEAYLRDLARGYHGDGNDEAVTDNSDGDFRQRYDMDGNGIPDWWEDLYGVGGESALDDHDNDGLCNIVEYMLSEKFEIRDALGKRVIFDPTKTCSVQALVPDCFFRIGSLYVGEVFADHDFIEDWWERQYDSTYASTLAYNATTDNDDDGWSEFAEARYSQQVSPIVADGKFHYDVTSGAVADYPIPAVQLKVKYNGARASEVESSSIAVRIGRDIAASHSPDATYWIEGSTVVNASQSGSGIQDTSTSTGISVSNEYKRLIGKWSNRRVYGTLTPGFVRSNSIRIQTAFDPSSVIYSWRYRTWTWYTDEYWSSYWHGTWRLARGTAEEYRAAQNKYGLTDVELLSSDDSFSNLLGLSVRTDLNSEVATLTFTGGKTLGTVNLKTGEYDFDLGIFAGAYVTEGTNTSILTSLEDQTYRIVYSANPSTGLPRDLYLGEADAGYIREGANQIMVWADLNGDKDFTVGEPFGYVRDVDIGWRTRAVEVEIFDHSPILPRIDMQAAAGSGSSGAVADRGQSVTDYCDGLIRAVMEAEMMEEKRRKELEQLQWIYTNVWTSASLDVSSLEQTRVRIVRWLVDGQPVYRLGVKPEVVLDQKMLLSNRAFLTEADILATGALDLDWAKLKTDVVDNSMTAWYGCDVTNVAYLVVIGDGKAYWDAAADTNSSPIILNRAIERRYDFTQAVAEPVSPKAEASVVLTARPTFKWTIPGEDDSSYTGYTAFQLQVLPVGSDAPVWDSGIRRLPPRDSLGRYVWTAPVYLGNDLEKSVNYRWRVAVMNAKFPTADWSAANVGYFRMEPNGLGSDSGSIHACVRYFGPTDEVLKVGTVRVEAFESPDFTGDPVARARIAASEWAAIASAESNQVCQVELMGLPHGSYYVRAYIDSDEYGTRNVRDSWESWGYLCDRSGKVDAIYAPTAVTVDGAVVSKDVNVIYLEDTDVNGNRIPDAYEMHVNGGSLDNGTINLDKTLDCGLAIRTGLVTNMTELAGLDDYTGLISHYADVLRTRGLVSLALGVPATSVSVDASGRIQVINRVESVEIESLAFDGDQLVLTVVPTSGAANVNAGAATLYGVTVTGPKEVTCRIERTETLSPTDWKEVATRTIGVGAGKASFDVPKGAGATGFYRVVIE